MRDPEIREALHRKVLARHHKNYETIVVDELGLCHGAARVDIAVINGQIHGFEIKSEKDTLDRLPHQISIYNDVLDKITIATSINHLEKVMLMVPEWWGIKIAIKGPRSGISFNTLRRAKRNREINGLALIGLLWRDEALNLLREAGASRGYESKKRILLYRRICEIYTIGQLRKLVPAMLKERKSMASDLKQM